MSRKDVYRSDEWNRIDPLERADILLVSEGVKPGATFGVKYRTNTEKVLEKLKLPYLPPRWHKSRYSYHIAMSDKTLESYLGKLMDKNLTLQQAHRAHGQFYGYPDCCIDAYVTPQIITNRNYRPRKNVFFSHVLKEYEKTNGSYPEALDYRIGVPCSVECPEALKQSECYRDVLLEHDKEAAEELKLFNKNGSRIIKAKYL